ncbi:MAG: response regulator [candidate division Zixibacteria bacterium]|jgi:DNA-binding NtrC family response regulator|nr:response regulator [candidate division Zixibacteria bacterium]
MDRFKNPIRMLLVDDEEEFLLATSQALGRRGFEVTAAPNGVTALDKVAAESFDVVVLDVKMPDISGLEVFNHIRASLPHIPVILLTGHPSIDDAFSTSKQGIADYLSKPVDLDELARKARHVVSEWAGKNHTEVDADEAIADRITVLIVDDETDLLDSLGRIFARRKIHTITAESGEKALALLQQEPIDVMVLDVKMPGMDGLEVLRRVKDKHSAVQVILLSGHPSVEAALEGVRLGAGEYLKKPADIDELIAAIARLHRQRLEFLDQQQRRLIDEIRRRYTD